MRKQAFLLAASVAVLTGCGGGHHHSSSSTTTAKPTGAAGSGMTVSLSANYGRVEVGYITGQGRAEGDLYLEITRQRIQNGDGLDVFNRTDGLAPIELRLPGFQTLSASIDVPFGSSVGRYDSQLLTQITFDPNRLLQEQSDGTLSEITGALPVSGATAPDPSSDPTYATIPQNLSVPVNLEARIRAFPGRDSLIQLRISDATFYYDTNYGTYVFNQDRFATLNNSTTGTDPSAQNLLASRISDFIRFPLSGLSDANKPVVRTDYSDTGAASSSTTLAGYVYFSGDNVAVSTDTPGSGSVYQEIAPTSDGFVLGTWQASQLAGFNGTYTLTDAQPVELNGTPTRLVSDYGNFRDYTQVLSGGGTFEMIMLPNSGEEYDEIRQGDLVAIVRNASGTITNLYYGGVDLSGGTFQLYPIRALNADPTDPTVIAARVTGTVTSYTDANGAVTTNRPSIRRFSYTMNGTLPAGFVSTGTAVVFRK